MKTLNGLCQHHTPAFRPYWASSVVRRPGVEPRVVGWRDVCYPNVLLRPPVSRRSIVLYMLLCVIVCHAVCFPLFARRRNRCSCAFQACSRSHPEVVALAVLGLELEG